MKPIILSLFLCLIAIQIHAQNMTPELILQPGTRQDGAATPEWIEAIRSRHDRERLADLQHARKPLTGEEWSWIDHIEHKIPIWLQMVDSLRIPFRYVTPPRQITILLGNIAGTDAFTSGDSTIGFDVGQLYNLYGSAAEPDNGNRIDRFFAHEFTHVLHKAWRRKHHLTFESPFEFALWECLTEGLGNYRSLSSRWTQEDGSLSTHALDVLDRLQPVFVERMSALKTATEEESVALMDGLSMGPFEQKWGALTVALWLTQATQGEDYNLQPWVDAGPSGVLVLAQKYLPEDLKIMMPQPN
jgi:hypothetical protein